MQPIATVPVRSGRATAGAATPLAAPRTLAWRPGSGTVWIPIGSWPSGVYFVTVHGSDGGRAYAPFVLRPRRLGVARVAVVVPTYSWQAYNFRGGGTWYACSCVHTVDLSRPYERHGVPPHFHRYERGFLVWLALHEKLVDVLSDQDLEQVGSGDALRRLYRLVIFSGHEEYVTAHQYDVVQRYRDLGGHLIFLSADNFFREVRVRGDAMTLVGRWRDLGRPEAGLLGSQYVDWSHDRYPNRPYRVVGARRLPWLFRGTELDDGSLIQGAFGIEADAVSPASPRGTVVVAEIPHIFGAATAQMTYYATAKGAEVFAAGTMNFGGSARLPQVSALLSNLWTHMAG